MWALRKSPQQQSEKEKQVLSRLFNHSASLKVSYQLSEALTKILNTKTSRSGGIRRLRNWISRVNESDARCFDTFIKTLEKWMPEIANYFTHRESSGFVEGFNNRIKVLKRRCYGIVDRKHLYQRISLDLSNWLLA
jgi:transposase